MQLVLTPELVLEAYRHGLFPMAYGAHSPYVNWVCPEMRGQLPIETFHIPRRLLATLRQNPFSIRVDTAFGDVIDLCAAPHEKRPETWINDQIRIVFGQLYAQGYAHSLECWDGSELIGGVYGLAMGKVFFAESMFSRARDASKIALVHLTARLWAGGFTVFDTQFINDHLLQFGAYELPFQDYKRKLGSALGQEADFKLAGQSAGEILQRYLNEREVSG